MHDHWAQRTNDTAVLAATAMAAGVAERHDAAGVARPGRTVILNATEVADDVIGVVVPVHRHAQ